MPNEYEADQGPFLSFLDWLDGVGQVGLNAAGAVAGTHGSFAGAGRKLVDSVSAIPDALLPGDWLPQVSQPQDEVTASSVANIDRKEHPGIAKAVDLVGGTVANPLSYVGLRGGALKAGLPLAQGTEIAGSRALIDKTKQMLGTAYDQHVPAPIKRIASASADNVRHAFNWMDVPPEEEAFLRQAKATGNNAARAATAQVENIYRSMTTAEREAVGEIAHGIDRGGVTDRTQWKTIDDPERFIQSRPDIRQDVVRDAVKQRDDLMRLLKDESPGAGIMRADPARDGDTYINRRFSGDYFDDGVSPLTFRKGGGDALKPRVKEIEQPHQLLDFLQKQDVDLDFDALSSDLNRASQQGKMAERGAIGRKLGAQAGLTESFMANEPGHVAAVQKAIGDISQQPGMKDYAYKLKQAFDGIPARSDNWFAQGLHKANKVFKGAATYGLVLPRVAFDVRNRTSALAQALSNPDARQTLGGNAKRVLSDLFGAFDDGVMKLTGSTTRKWGKSGLTEQLDAIDNAFRSSGGSPQKVRELLGARPDSKLLLEALDNGVLNNFVDSEQLLTRMQKSKGWQKTYNIMEWPAEIAQGLEQRMRLGTFLDLRKSGINKSGAEAAQTIRDTYLDYDMAGHANRTLRDIVPFAAFATQNLKQQAKFLAEQPVAGVAAAQLFGDDEGMPKYPWLEQQMSIPWGLDEKGNAQYVSGLGLPIEALTSIPGTGGDDFYRDVVGQMQPLLKTGISYVADKDPLTGNAFGQYDKVLGESRGAAGRAYNIAKGTGLTQPITGPFGQLENLTDDRKSGLERGLQATTGLRFTSVEADLAKRQQLEAYLRARPDVRSSETLYQTSDDPQTAAMLKKLRETKERLKEKRQAAAAM